MMVHTDDDVDDDGLHDAGQMVMIHNDLVEPFPLLLCCFYILI